LVQEDQDDQEDKDALYVRTQIDTNKAKQPAIIEDRLLVLEKKLKTKFSNCYESVRKAFLALDTDYDGFITVEDILKYFGNEPGLNYNDLKKIMIDKDHKKQGKIGYSDFSKWLGSAIHMSEGFYFRHDSIKNPFYERNLEKMANSALEKDKKLASKAIMKGDMEKKILMKMQVQWKTIRKAFTDLNMEKTGKISQREFKFFLDFWGMDVTEKEFKQVFSRFDIDGDGFISYKDF